MSNEILTPMENGNLLGTPEGIAKYIREMLPTYDNHRSREALMQLNDIMQRVNMTYRNLCRDSLILTDEGQKARNMADRLALRNGYEELRKARKLVYKRIEATEKFNTTAPVPNNLIQNYIATKELVSTFGEVLDMRGSGEAVKMQGAELSRDFVNQLAKIETAYIIDAIGYYVNRYRETGGNTPEIQYQASEEWDSYMITDTFDNLCNNCQATGSMRKKIRDILFGPEKPLQYVTLLLPLEGKSRKAYKKVQFINTVIEEGTKTQAGGWYAHADNTGEISKIGRVTLQISAKLYRFLDPLYREGKAKGMDLSGGYHMRPLALTDSISNMFEEMRRLSQSVFKDRMQMDMAGFDNAKGAAAVAYINLTWTKGLENRTQDLVITHKKLADLGYLPSYGHKGNAKKGSKKARDVDAIARVISNILATNNLKEYFPRCSGAYCDKDNFRIILTLQQEGNPPANTGN